MKFFTRLVRICHLGRQKLQRLISLAHSARVAVCALDAAAAEAGITLPVYVEVNMGGNRCGVAPGEPALDLARRVTEAPHLAFVGLQAYHGWAQHLRAGTSAAKRSPRRPTRPGKPATS
jgi:D-serine deaminase-like pyridoxal phosphate-dependent protein